MKTLLRVLAIGVLTIGVLGVLPGRVWATSFVERPFPDTVHDAPTIARGKIGMSYADWSAGGDGRKALYTYYEFQVDEVFKGQLGDSHRAMIREIGGEKNGVGLQVSGAAKFERGEDVVLLLGPANLDGSHDVRGLMMGKYSVEKDEEGREVLVGAGVSRVTHAGHSDEPGHGQDGTGPVKKWTLDALRSLVREQARDAVPVPDKSAIPVKSQGSAEALQRPIPQPLATGDAAPGLQPEEEGSKAASSSHDPRIWVWGGVAALLAGVLLRLLRKR